MKLCGFHLNLYFCFSPSYFDWVNEATDREGSCLRRYFEDDTCLRMISCECLSNKFHTIEIYNSQFMVESVFLNAQFISHLFFIISGILVSLESV